MVDHTLDYHHSEVLLAVLKSRSVMRKQTLKSSFHELGTAKPFDRKDNYHRDPPKKEVVSWR